MSLIGQLLYLLQSVQKFFRRQAGSTCYSGNLIIKPGLIRIVLRFCHIHRRRRNIYDSCDIADSMQSRLQVGGGIAKLLSVPGVRKSRYFIAFLAAGIISVVMGLLVLFNWSEVSARFLGVVLGLELVADAIFLGAYGLRDRDKEEHREALDG